MISLPNLKYFYYVVDQDEAQPIVDGLKHISKHKHLEYLGVKNISAGSIKHINNLPLHELYIHYSHLSDEDILELANMKSLTVLGIFKSDGYSEEALQALISKDGLEFQHN